MFEQLAPAPADGAPLWVLIAAALAGVGAARVADALAGPPLPVFGGRARQTVWDARPGAAMAARAVLGALIGVAATLWLSHVVAGPAVWAGAALWWALLALAFVDVRRFLLPDELTLPLAALGLLCAVAFDLLDGAPLLGETARWPAHAAGAAIGFAVFWGLAAVYRSLRGREGLGLGDAKLFAAAGAWTGWAGLPSVALWAGVLGLASALVIGAAQGRLSGRMRVPFGPFLALGLWITWLHGPLRPLAG